MIQYPCKIVYSKSDKAYLVDFINLPGCVTYGSTLEKAQDNAREALSGYLETVDSRKMKIPEPSRIRGKNVYYIKPEKNVAFAVWLKTRRLKSGYTQEQIADKLKISYQSYQRFENPSKSNPTLKTIARLEEILDEDLIAV